MDSDQWISDTNQAISIHLVDHQNQAVATFHPEFTYPIFGEAEKLYGFKDLSINLYIFIHDAFQYLSIDYSEKLEFEDSSDDVDIQTKLKEFLADDVVYTEKEFSQHIDEYNANKERKSLTFGEIIKEDEQQDLTLLRCPTQDLPIALKRIQCLAIFFIEGASLVDVQDSNWILYTLWSRGKDGSLKSFVGYCSVYRFFFFDLQDLSCSRARMSQFLILPPYRNLHLGSFFYDFVFEDLLKGKDIKEITVEDPSEAFGDLRDKQDLLRLLKAIDYRQSEFETILDLKTDKSQSLRRSLKLSKLQFHRCLEMAGLYFYSEDGSQEKNTKMRIFIKKRLYIQNKDVLQQLESDEIKSKLQEAFENVNEGYLGIIKSISEREETSEPKQKKRKLIKC